MFREAKWMMPCVLACFVLVSVASADLIPFAAVEGQDGYEDSPFAWIHTGDYETDEDVLFDEHTSEWRWGDSPLIGSAYALADIRTPESGTGKALTRLFYHDPFLPDWLSLAADVETWKPFRIDSGTLPLGTQVNVTLGIHYAGTLQALEGVADKYSYVRAEGTATVCNDLGNVLGERIGEAKVKCELTDGNHVYTVETLDDWIGHLSEGVDGNGDPIYSLVYDDTIDFTASVGERYGVYFDLSTIAKTSEGGDVGWEASQTFAQVDFADTAGYSLGSSSDVEFVMVAEPSVLCLAMALAVLSLAFLPRPAGR